MCTSNQSRFLFNSTFSWSQLDPAFLFLPETVPGKYKLLGVQHVFKVFSSSNQINYNFKIFKEQFFKK